jgi:pimeloyl-ACP methyl ester carboxylesterase
MDHAMVPVPGGDLFVACWGGTGPPVLAVHGITASHAAWQWVADELAGAVTLFAPDLRGRGASGGLPGPFGMAAHAADLVAALDYLDVERALVVGHSMGAYVAATMAARYPDRVSALLLVDGGLPQDVPDDVDLDAYATELLGPALARLDMTFIDEAAYFEFWRPHPAIAAEGWGERLERYLRWDLGGRPPELRSRVSKEAATADYIDLMAGDAALDYRRIGVPTRLMRAPRGLLGQPEPLLSDRSVAEHLAQLPDARHEVVAGTNHYTIVMGTGARVVADRIRAQLQGGGWQGLGSPTALR